VVSPGKGVTHLVRHGLPQRMFITAQWRGSPRARASESCRPATDKEVAWEGVLVCETVGEVPPHRRILHLMIVHFREMVCPPLRPLCLRYEMTPPEKFLLQRTLLQQKVKDEHREGLFHRLDDSSGKKAHRGDTPKTRCSPRKVSRGYHPS